MTMTIDQFANRATWNKSRRLIWNEVHGIAWPYVEEEGGRNRMVYKVNRSMSEALGSDVSDAVEDATEEATYG
jgi:hypothetical protein